MDETAYGCFATKKIDCDVDALLQDLKNNFLAIEISKTLKIHVLLDHLKKGLQFLSVKKGRGVGIWLEQAGESILREFLEYWGKYKVKVQGALYSTFPHIPKIPSVSTHPPALTIPSPRPFPNHRFKLKCAWMA